MNVIDITSVGKTQMASVTINLGWIKYQFVASGD